MYLESTVDASISFTLYSSNGNKIETTQDITIQLPTSTGRYLNFPLGVATNNTDLKNIASIEIKISSVTDSSSYLIDEIELSYFEEIQTNQPFSTISKDELEDKYEDYIDIKRNEGFDHHRQIEAEQNNR